MSLIMIPAVIGIVIILGFALIGIASFIAFVGIVIFEIMSSISTAVSSDIYLQWIVTTISVIILVGIGMNRIRHVSQRHVDHRKINRRNKTCSVCQGAGGHGEYTSSENPCDACDGNGTLDEILSNSDPNCKYCSESGMIKPGKFYLITCNCVLEKWNKIIKPSKN